SGVDAGPKDAGVDSGVPLCDAGFFDGGSATDGGVSFAFDVQPIFNARRSCHFTVTPSGGLPLTPDASYAALVNVAANCNATVKRVLPGSLSGSMLWRKLEADPTRCGNPMPNLTAGLCTIAPAEHAKVQSWIAQGAKNN